MTGLEPEGKNFQEKTVPDIPLRTLRIICIAVSLSGPLYLLIILLLFRFGDFKNSLFLDQVPLRPEYALYGVLFLSVSVPLLFQKILELQEKKTGKKNNSKKIVVFAAAETGNLFGLILFLLYGYHAEFFIPFLISGVFFYFLFPRDLNQAAMNPGAGPSEMMK